jgi:hypothetical protein
MYLCNLICQLEFLTLHHSQFNFQFSLLLSGFIILLFCFFTFGDFLAEFVHFLINAKSSEINQLHALIAVSANGSYPRFSPALIFERSQEAASSAPLLHPATSNNFPR